MPQPLNQQTSNLTFAVDLEDGSLLITAALRQFTASELIDVVVTCSAPNITIIDSEIDSILQLMQIF